MASLILHFHVVFSVAYISVYSLHLSPIYAVQTDAQRQAVGACSDVDQLRGTFFGLLKVLGLK